MFCAVDFSNFYCPAQVFVFVFDNVGCIVMHENKFTVLISPVGSSIATGKCNFRTLQCNTKKHSPYTLRHNTHITSMQWDQLFSDSAVPLRNWLAVPKNVSSTIDALSVSVASVYRWIFFDIEVGETDGHFSCFFFHTFSQNFGLRWWKVGQSADPIQTRASEAIPSATGRTVPSWVRFVDFVLFFCTPFLYDFKPSKPIRRVCVRFKTATCVESHAIGLFGSKAFQMSGACWLGLGAFWRLPLGCNGGYGAVQCAKSNMYWEVVSATSWDQGAHPGLAYVFGSNRHQIGV